MENQSISNQSHSQTGKLTTLPGAKRDRIRLVKKFPGLQAEVAKRLGLKGYSGVNHVIRKRITSKRIEQGIVAYINEQLSQQNPAAA